MTPRIFDPRPCELGEGALWHPARRQLFWFDILGRRLLSRVGAEQLEWTFDRPVSAAGWVDDDTLLVAGAGALMRFDIATGARETLCALEPENPGNRSNDGRADPFGGFWIGTMGLRHERRAGSIWRYFRGELRRLQVGVTIPNAISFTPDGRAAHFADTAEQRVWRQPLDANGWPQGAATLLLDLRGANLNPDGAVCDAVGHLWLALWGDGSVARFDPDGRLVRKLKLPTPQPSCPAFGGADLTTLYVATARTGLDAPDARAGAVYAFDVDATGQREHRVAL